jgi:putative intracellular protease/amidase
MPNRSGYIFVLWGDKFEEVTATIFVTELRKAGFLVKVVGLNPPQIRGVCGLALVPDLMLDKALLLAAKAKCVIVPCPVQNIKRLKNDPRLGEFLQRTRVNKAKLVIGPSNMTNVSDLEVFPTTDNIVVYADGEDLVGFVHKLTGWLLSSSKGQFLNP